jgi:carbonic anhydrase/acetyltransferase-like protein (isoleucine patch superfamily)
MPIREEGGARPRLADDVFVAPNAEVIGDVTMAERSSVWFSSVLRANGAAVSLGVGADVQDNCLVDSEPGRPARLGDYTSLGHGAVVHGSVLEDHVLIAMNATVMPGCTIGTGSIVAANATVPPGTVVPPRSLVIGDRGRVARQVTDAEYARIELTCSHYMELARAYREALTSGE